jgi:hypothetical protein
MEQSVELHEQIDKCQELSRDLELYTSKKKESTPGFSQSFISTLKQRKKTLDFVRNPEFVPNQKFVDNSRIL